MLSPTTQANGTPAAMARSSMARARCGLRKANLLRDVRRRPARRIVGPGLGQIEGPIDKGVPPARDIGRKYANLAVRDLACGARVLPSHTAGGLALLQEPGLVHHQDGIRFG